MSSCSGVGGNKPIAAGPFTQVDQLAAFTAKGSVDILFNPHH